MSILELTPGYYQVTSNGRWWTAAVTASGWNIHNEAGQRLRADGKLGARVVAAVEKCRAGES